MIYIEKENDYWYRIVLQGDISKDFIPLLKNKISNKHRMYNSRGKYYTIHINALKLLVLVAKVVKEEYVFGVPPPNPYKIMHLYSSIPIEAVHSVYKTLSLLYHPDREGGSHEKMVSLNNAYEQILRERKVDRKL